MQFIKTKSFHFRDIDVPFWRLCEHGKTQCVTAIAFAVHHGLLKKRNGNCWRLPRSSKFLKAKIQLANTYFYKNAGQFEKDLAKKIRTGLVKEWRRPIPFQHATKLVNLETLLLILKFSGMEKAIVAAFQLFVADTFRLLTEQRYRGTAKKRKLLATIKKEKVFKRKHQTEPLTKH